jgi:predicted O-methyltransferase YrrM
MFINLCTASLMLVLPVAGFKSEKAKGNHSVISHVAVSPMGDVENKAQSVIRRVVSAHTSDKPDDVAVLPMGHVDLLEGSISRNNVEPRVGVSEQQATNQSFSDQSVIRRVVNAHTSGAFPSFPIPCRDDYAIVAQQHFAKLGSAAEIGVYRGDFAAKNLKHWYGKYYMVDAWNHRPGDPRDKNYGDLATNDANFKATQEATSFASSRTELIRSLSVDAALRFASESLDWVYVDALHTKAALLKDLEAWYPKVRPGGLISGDDYGDKDDTELVPAKRSFYGVAKANQWGVISGVNEFTRARGIQLHISWMSDCYKFNAWYFVKPSVPAPTSAVFPSLPVPCRDDLAIVAQQHFAKLGSAVEIGAWRGDFAAKNLKHWHGKYYMVDATNDANFKATQEATSFASSRTEMIRSLSADAALHFAPESLDWVYVDARHTKAGLLKDLEAWYPKIRPGGLISGADYGDKDDTQLVSAKRWAARYGGRSKENQWEVISGINEFTRARGIQLHVTWLSDCYKYNAWYFVKPVV